MPPVFALVLVLIAVAIYVIWRRRVAAAAASTAGGGCPTPAPCPACPVYAPPTPCPALPACAVTGAPVLGSVRTLLGFGPGLDGTYVLTVLTASPPTEIYYQVVPPATDAAGPAPGVGPIVGVGNTTGVSMIFYPATMALSSRWGFRTVVPPGSATTSGKTVVFAAEPGAAAPHASSLRVLGGVSPQSDGVYAFTSTSSDGLWATYVQIRTAVPVGHTLAVGTFAAVQFNAANIALRSPVVPAYPNLVTSGDYWTRMVVLASAPQIAGTTASFDPPTPELVAILAGTE